MSGTGFTTTDTVQLGGNACGSITFLSSTQLTCVTPAHAAGAVDVTVTDLSTGLATTLSSGFVYFSGLSSNTQLRISGGGGTSYGSSISMQGGVQPGNTGVMKGNSLQMRGGGI